MTVVIFNGAPSKPAQPEVFRDYRKQERLTITQAAYALGVSTSAIEAWERGVNPAPSIDTVKEAFEAFSINYEKKTFKKNLLFGSYPLRLARELVEMDIASISAKFKVTPSSWAKFESNVRPLPESMLVEVEDFVRERLAAVCGV